jgi:hypothetical protein
LGRGFEGNVCATGRANRLVAHPHRRRVSHAVEDRGEVVSGVFADVGTTCRGTVVEASCRAVALAEGIVGRRAGHYGCITGAVNIGVSEVVLLCFSGVHLITLHR